MDHQRGFQHGEHQGECKAELALKVIQGRWKVLILRELADGIQRFSDLRCALEGVSQKVLTAQLRDLEAEGVVHRAIHPEVPPPLVDHALTDLGRELLSVLDGLHAWGERQASKADGERPRSSLCKGG